MLLILPNCVWEVYTYTYNNIIHIHLIMIYIHPIHIILRMYISITFVVVRIIHTNNASDNGNYMQACNIDVNSIYHVLCYHNMLLYNKCSCHL